MNPDNKKDGRNSPKTTTNICLFGLALAVVGIGYANIISNSCKQCDSLISVDLHDRLLLAGAIFYPALLLLMTNSKTQRLVATLVAFAAGLHIVLIKLLLDSSIVCVPCYLTATGAFIAVLAILFEQRRLRSALLFVIFGTALTGILTVPALFPVTENLTADQLPYKYQTLLKQAKRECNSTSSQTCIIVFERPGCAACDILKTRSEIEHLEQLGGIKVQVIRRRAGADHVAPTVAIRHKKNWNVFIGSPTDDQIFSLFDPNK